MNAKSILIAAAVLATPACTVSEEEMTAASNDAVTARVSLNGETYLSRDTFTIEEDRRRPNGEYVRDRILVRYRLRFIPAGTGYSYDGEGAMEYETIIDAVQVNKPELAYSDDVAYYAKRTDENSFRLFDCDSSHRCADGERSSKLNVFTQNGRKVVKLSGLNLGDDRPGLYLEGVTKREILFDPGTAAPETATLSTARTCTANGYTLTVAPAEAPSTTGASYELKRGSAVIEQDRWTSLQKDVLGHYFVVAPWSGLLISLGDNAVRYENEVSGLTIDFPKGACSASE